MSMKSSVLSCGGMFVKMLRIRKAADTESQGADQLTA